MTIAEIEAYIRGVGLTPVRRDTLYNPLPVPDDAGAPEATRS